MTSLQRSRKRTVVLTNHLRQLPRQLLVRVGTVRKESTLKPPRKQSTSLGTTRSSLAISPSSKLLESSGNFRPGNAKKARRAQQSRVDLDGKALPAKLRLRCLKVGQKTLNRYLQCIRDFENWCKNVYARNSGTLDSRVTRYITYLYDQDAELSEATYLVYGLQLLRCQEPKEQFLVGSKLALAGWRKQSPGAMRLPVPEEFIFDLGTLALEQGRVDIAVLLCIQYDGYLRPSEAITLTKEHVTSPQGRRYPHWGLIIAPSSLKETTKTGNSDDSILLADRPHNRWMRDCMRLYMKHVDAELFPRLSLSQLESWCRQACTQLQYKTSVVMPHVLRHSGASNDAYHNRRPLNEIQKRGRWQARSSVSRYEKHSLLLAQWRQCAVGRKQVINNRSEAFPAQLLRTLRQSG